MTKTYGIDRDILNDFKAYTLKVDGNPSCLLDFLDDLEYPHSFNPSDKTVTILLDPSMYDKDVALINKIVDAM